MDAPNFSYEKRLWRRGYRFVVGIDEVGRGAFAGPVVVGAVIFPKQTLEIEGISLSKLGKRKYPCSVIKSFKKTVPSDGMDELKL